jgi:hypothetical protein
LADAGYWLLDITDLNRSPKHGVHWLCELAFLRNGSRLFGPASTYPNSENFRRTRTCGHRTTSGASLVSSRRFRHNREMSPRPRVAILAEAPTVELLDGAVGRAWDGRDRLREMGERAASDLRKWVSMDPAEEFAKELESLLDGNIDH